MDTCGAKTRGTGEPCRNRPASGRTRCRFHGGATLTGSANPAYKHGAYSQYLTPQEQVEFEDWKERGGVTGDGPTAELEVTIWRLQRALAQPGNRPKDGAMILSMLIDALLKLQKLRGGEHPTRVAMTQVLIRPFEPGEAAAGVSVDGCSSTDE
jgi:hypothetical protein